MALDARLVSLTALRLMCGEAWMRSFHVGSAARCAARLGQNISVTALPPDGGVALSNDFWARAVGIKRAALHSGTIALTTCNRLL